MIVTGATNVKSTELSETARAKVNLTLRVVGRRADGFHDLESVVAFADCVDRLTLMPGTDLSLVAGGPRAQECGQAADNLVLKAARLLGERVANLTTGVFALDKHLPVAAGIGGGSADAAAALRLLARANGIAIGDPRLIEAARLTGADVPVCVCSEACVMTGVGETLQPLGLPAMPAVLVNPRVPVATKDVFAALGLRKGELHVGVSDVIEAIVWPKTGAPMNDWLAMLADGTNDLEPPAIRVQPVIGEVLARLRATGARLSRMSGSGATCFAIFGNEADARNAAQTIRLDRPQWWVHAGTLS
ncbi:4-diphosphocytidyl-2-C-methyl-D-erythritol kinase [Nitrobacter hamburgensis X14]|uniref:4-diphosphocytidyl-2-C-methyl-D-erythritol kinase n=1 Tax=Nitrobacter hamburgensis (strain DSM 10229 / NCIMB 13809 / X14) TaxID=323097 RepID=ISPE_NITHX|nr:4-(cytidine 5'-diphospho)-2-C-methyl-D-erythritol kinase [Nitrobacter hamburgensis]Q1QIJ6.1 RecName: Full=4-diphosphocytidyl-2-C-methyl-D-erythritol kinase; Short=CMK; AltName: Full=4-(cytidine-5'-diphospho)-2-C-methyl-D-erythritol kinase [Nitrobacter hamburgensis X14]ABE63951.1 4-diphosphocytidyl-2-C-methyl-D-erythritol kinase [Nitrobacter hamburgensis X14]